MSAEPGTFWWHVWRAAGKATLSRFRAEIRQRFPGVHGADWAAMMLLLVLLRMPDRAFYAICRLSCFVRRRQRPLPADPTNTTVLHVTASFDLGGTQTQIKNLCTTERKAFVHETTELFPEWNYLYRRDVRVEIERYTGPDPLRRAAGRLVADWNTRCYRAVQVWKIMRDIRHERPRIVVGWGHEICTIAFAAAALTDVPEIVFCIRTVNPKYGWTSREWGDWLLRTHRLMLPMVSKVIVNSTLLRADHARWVGMEPNEIAVCPNGMRLEPLTGSVAPEARAAVRQRYGIRPNTIVITNVGRFSGEKGQMSLVEATERLRTRPSLPQFVWLLLGDGPTQDDVRTAAESRGFSNFIFTGRTDEVREALAASDIFVMPSDFEGMPNAMMEAMAAGLPCVSTKLSGALDIARDGCEALYYDARDAQALADHLAWLITHPDDARAMGQRAATRIKDFSIEHAKAVFEAALESIATPAEPLAPSEVEGT